MQKPKYFKGKVSKGFIAIYSGRMVLRIATGLLYMFLPIFLYELFGLNVRFVILYYIICHFLYGSLVAWGCRFLNKIGLRRSLRISIFWGGVYYFIFYLLSQYNNGFEAGNRSQIFFLLFLTIIFITLHRLMYWVPLHTDLAKFTDKRNRAKQLSLIEATTVVVRAIMPIIAGFILIRYGYDVLFVIAILIWLCAIIPLITLPRTKERFSWTYCQTWREFFSRERRKAVLAFFGNGAEDVVGVMIWPIFIWELLKGNYFEVGALTSLIVGATVVLQLVLGKFVDVKGKSKLLHYGSFFYASGWIIKIFIVTAFQIFVVATYHNLAKIFARTPFDTLTYERAADQGHYVDEYTVIHEMAIQYGKVLMLIFALILSYFFSIQWVFILAALASLAMNFLADEDAISKGRHAG